MLPTTRVIFTQHAIARYRERVDNDAHVKDMVNAVRSSKAVKGKLAKKVRAGYLMHAGGFLERRRLVVGQ